MYKKTHFHFVGINGIGMSGIAKILHKQGHIVSGCDLAHDLSNVQELINNNCNISNHHNSTICNEKSIDIVVYSSDVSFNSQELINARNRGIKTVQRAVILAEIMRSKYAIGVAGSHGKTTTTAIIGHILTEAQTDPTIIVGGVMNNTNTNSRYGSGKYAIAETDESDRSLLLLPVSLAVLTNIDFEHTNIYKNIDEVIDVFTNYINQLPPDGTAIVCLDDDNIQKNVQNFIPNITTYGTTDQADIQAINLTLHADNSSFDIINNTTKVIIGNFTINMPGIYNILNSTAAIATSLKLEIPISVIKQSLISFQGVDRRFTFKGLTNNSVEIFDDYGHHPTEIYHSLTTARKKNKNNLIVVFQPQRYSRTHHLWNQFITTFQQSDITHLILTDVYAASETPIPNVTGKQLAQEIQLVSPHIKVEFIPFDPNLDAIKNKVIEITSKNDLLLLLGAGKINKLANKLLS